MAEYFVVTYGREQGPYSAIELGELLNEDLLQQELSIREAGSERLLSRYELLNVLAGAHASKPAVSLEFPVAFESFTQPASNPFRFRGKGNVGILRDMVGLEGRRSPPFWFSRQDAVTIPVADILNVARAGKIVSFESDAVPLKFGKLAQPVTLIFADEASAASFADALPRRLSHEEGIERVQRAEFSANLARRSSHSFVVPLLVVANIVMFFMLGMDGVGWAKTDSKKLIEWGSNFGPLTAGGEWWRLLTSTFLHGGFAHLLVNMAVLFDTGRLCERLYGSARFLALYMLCGLCGSAASIWWNPLVNSVGASGAIFGVLGALLVFMIDARNGVPPSIMKRHQLTVGVFIAYALFEGYTNASVDNACHLGGLVGGLVLGWAFARPVDLTAHTGKSPLWPAAGTVVVVAAIAGLLLATPNTRSIYELQQRFAGDLKWYALEEKVLAARTQEFLGRAKTSGANLSEHLSEVTALADAWRAAHDRFAAYRFDAAGRGKELADLQAELVLYLDLRQRALNALAAALRRRDVRNDDPQIKEFKRLWQQADVAIQRIAAMSNYKRDHSGGK